MGRIVLRLVEAACAVAALLLVVRLFLNTDIDRLRAAHQAGQLTQLAIMLIALCTT